MLRSKKTEDTILSSIFITLIISGFVGIFILFLVNTPEKASGRDKLNLGSGNWDYRILIRSRNGTKEFNVMSKVLRRAYNEIKDWSENLNVKVEDKFKGSQNFYEQVVQMEKMVSLGKLSATVAHGLNNPL